ncbi:hypothetical protein EGW08_018600 [Elysia chlorotica]|uniref:Calcitonin peptide-like domain-containing protein n=1 Tax=Elysia chlorotica TaxID=188477 RepID=A0A3S1BS51_ELYCH|nr:hypothetical protein EGW08_018600 [Elysia chlorotica]
MKLLCCISLCLATVSSYSLQTGDAVSGADPSSSQESTGSGPNLLGSASLAALLRYGGNVQDVGVERVPGEGGDSCAGCSRYNPQAMGNGLWERAPSSSRQLPSLAQMMMMTTMPQKTCAGTASALLGLFRDSLSKRGFSDKDVGILVEDILQRLSSEMVSSGPRHESETVVRGYSKYPRYPAQVAEPSYSKRGGYIGRGPYQMRYAPRFGTKLVPNMKNGDGGSKLLRYGRSVKTDGASGTSGKE